MRNQVAQQVVCARARRGGAISGETEYNDDIVSGVKKRQQVRVLENETDLVEPIGKKSLELWERLWEPKIATLVNVHEHGRTLPLVF